MNSKAVVEERRATRVSVDLKATYAVNGMPVRPTRVHEISATGLRMLTREKLSFEGFIDVDITFDRDKRLRVRGQVVRLAASDPNVFDYGVRVIGDNAMKNALRSLVLQMSLKGSSKPNVETAPFIAKRTAVSQYHSAMAAR